MAQASINFKQEIIELTREVYTLYEIIDRIRNLNANLALPTPEEVEQIKKESLAKVQTELLKKYPIRPDEQVGASEFAPAQENETNEQEEAENTD